MRVGRIGRRARKIKRKNMNKEEFKKKTLEALDDVYWVNTISNFVSGSDYAGNFEQRFGNISRVSLMLDDYKVSHNKIDEFHTFLKGFGFGDVIQYGIMDYEHGNYYHELMKMMVDAQFLPCPTKKKDDDDEDDDEYDNPISSEKFVIVFTPFIKNKGIIINFINALLDSDLLDIPENDKKFYMIAQSAHGLYKQQTSFNSIPIKDDRYDLYYGEKFPHEKLKNFVNDDKCDSLLLLHGDPGTGKSNFLKDLITESKRDVIYIPPSMMATISSPGFVSFMLQNKKNILIIEDAEEILSIERNSATNNLLGICDGFLKDALGLKVVCTFNCDIGKIDPALMRKGRMYFEYKFGKLSIDECNKLAEHVGLEIDVKEPMTLADLFNSGKMTSVENSFEERRIGFF